MANCCITSVVLMREEESEFTDSEVKSISIALEEITHCAGATDYVDENRIEWNGDTRWNVPTEKLVEISKQYACDIRAVGREDGVGFVQVVSIEAGGLVIQDEEIGYAL